MTKEQLVGVQLTDDKKCICNPTVLLGTNSGLWDFKKETAPKGVLLDLNAAWELFLSKKNFLNIGFDIVEHHQHEVIDGVVYEEGDVTYTLKDNSGNPTGATFTLRQNTNPIKHIDVANGKLYLYYSEIRPLEDKDEGNPIVYVRDESGNIVIDPETGKPLIYDYVSISIIEIFDNDETRKLFPWYADENNTVKIRDSIEGQSGNLGDMSITSSSEVYIKDLDSGDLVSVQSIYDRLKRDLGFEPIFSPYPEGYKAEGSTFPQTIDSGFKNNSSILDTLNELIERTRINNKLLSGKIVDNTLKWNTLLQFVSHIQNNAFNEGDVPNLLQAINWIQEQEIGPFNGKIQIYDSDGNTKTVNVGSITEALKELFQWNENFKKLLEDHINDKSNPHEVTALQLFVTVNDPNDENNVNCEEEFYVDYTVDGAIKKAFTRINTDENNTGKISRTIGTPEEMELLDNLDEVLGNDNPSIISLSLDTKQTVDNIIPIPNSFIDALP